jgi:hypothetical protein
MTCLPKIWRKTLRDIDGQTRNDLASGVVSRWFAVAPTTIRNFAARLLELIPASHEARNPILDALAENGAARIYSHSFVSPGRLGAQGNHPARLRELAARDLPKAQSWLTVCTDPADRRTAERAKMPV